MVKVKRVVRVTPPPLPVTVMVAGPVGVLAAVVRVRVVEHVGVQEVLEKEALAPAGSPEAEKVTACELPETRVAVMVFVTDEPCVTDLSPPFASEKSNGAVTVRVKRVVRVTPPPLPVTVMVAGPVGVLAAVVRVRVREEERGEGVVEKEARAPAGSPEDEKVTGCEVPETRVAVMVFVTDEPCVIDLLPPFDSEKSKVEDAFTVRVKLVVWVTPPPLPVTVMVAGPVGVLAAVVRVRVVEHVGVQEVLEKEALAPAGSPEAEKVTGCEVPETRVAVMVFVTDEPCVTDLLPPFDSEKSKVEDAFTV